MLSYCLRKRSRIVCSVLLVLNNMIDYGVALIVLILSTWAMSKTDNRYVSSFHSIESETNGWFITVVTNSYLLFYVANNDLVIIKYLSQLHKAQ